MTRVAYPGPVMDPDPPLGVNPKSLAFRILRTRSRKVMVDTPFESLDFKLFIFGHHLSNSLNKIK